MPQQYFRISVCVSLVLLIRGYSSLSLPQKSVLKGSSPDAPAAHIPIPDGLFHFYMLPVGQGDAHVIQCPNGDITIMDFGSSDNERNGFFNTTHLTQFLSGQYHLIRNVILSHNHYDHYYYLSRTLDSTKDLSGLMNIYVSCTEEKMVVMIKDWLDAIQGHDKVRLFNGGEACGPNGVPCGDLDICPGDPDVTAKMYAANMGHCTNSNLNLDSLAFKVTHKEVTIFFQGDFEDATNNINENGIQKAMVDYYGSELEVTIYKISHHGAATLANKPITCAAHKPKALFVSSNFMYSNYRHPRCVCMDRFINDVGTLCKPGVTNPADPFYCGKRPGGDVSLRDKLQTEFRCGESSLETNDGWRHVSDNEYAIYTTTLDERYMNAVAFSSDGQLWGFTNNILPKFNSFNNFKPIVSSDDNNEC